MRRALITGITGQDGSYLAESLLMKGYEVHGIVRRAAIEAPEHRMSRINHIFPQLHIHPASVESFASIFNVVREVNPEECYHLAAQSFVTYSFEDEFSTLMTNINGTHHLLSAIHQLVPSCRLYFAASSEMFGNAQPPQNENTPFRPRSAYGISKLTGYHLVRNYREAYGMFAVNGILFNHESPRRGYEFVTRKITSHVARIKKGLSRELRLGNIEAKRDWGHARDYVEAMWLMLQKDSPEDYVIGTGESHSVREFLEIAFGHLGMDYRKYVVVDPTYYRPAEIFDLVADPGKAKAKLDWSHRCRFEDLVIEMTEREMNGTETASIGNPLELPMSPSPSVIQPFPTGNAGQPSFYEYQNGRKVIQT